MTKNNLKFLILLSLISVFIFLITGCSSDSEDTLSSARSYDVNFEVTDTNESPQKVEAASLTLAGETKKTNAAGTVSFRKADGKYKYEVSAQGYKYFSDYIVVKGADTIKLVKLISLNPGGSEPGGEEDTTAPILNELFAWIDGYFYGVDNSEIELGIKKLIDPEGNSDQSFDYFIVYFSEEVKIELEFDLEQDFELKYADELIDINEAIQDSYFLILRINESILSREKLKSEGAEFSLKVNESGRQKIFDLADNMLAGEPDSLSLIIEPTVSE
jgi:hypothetical protein